MFYNRGSVLLENLCSIIGDSPVGGSVIFNRDIKVSTGKQEHVR